MDVTGFGALNLDKILYVDKIPGRDEEGFIGSVEYFPGGSAANTIVGLSRLGLSTAYIGRVGNDADGTRLLADMQGEGVDAAGIRVAVGRSGTCLIMVDRRGDRAILVDPGVNDTVDYGEIDVDSVSKSGFIHFTSFVCRDSQASFEAQKKLAARVDADISFDPGTLYAERGLSEMRPIIRRCRVVLLSEHELRLMTGFGVEEGAEALVAEGVEIVAVKLGERGCYVTDGKHAFTTPAYSVNVVDTTGAGDAFNAGFIYGLRRGRSLADCSRLGNRVAAYCIQERGARAGLPKADIFFSKEL